MAALCGLEVSRYHPGAAFAAFGSHQQRREHRILFSQAQITALKRRFKQQCYIFAQERERLAEEVGLPGSQVKGWFEKHRYKIKKAINDRSHAKQHSQTSKYDKM
jgi:hypothetical protein